MYILNVIDAGARQAVAPAFAPAPAPSYDIMPSPAPGPATQRGDYLSQRGAADILFVIVANKVRAFLQNMSDFSST